VVLTRTLVALTAPPWPAVASRGAVNSRNHIEVTAESGRSWLIFAQMTRVNTIVTTMPQAIDQKSEIPIRRSTVNTRRKTTTPTPHAT